LFSFIKIGPSVICFR